MRLAHFGRWPEKNTNTHLVRNKKSAVEYHPPGRHPATHCAEEYCDFLLNIHAIFVMGRLRFIHS